MAAISAYSSITERQEEYSGEPEAAGCGCFRRFCFGWGNDHLLSEPAGAGCQPWLVEKLKKVREVSEMAAGPKWKNLVRRIGRFCSSKKSNKDQQFQYSPQSYALNFTGHGEEEEEDGQLLHSFSTRFAPHAPTSNDQRGRFGL